MTELALQRRLRRLLLQLIAESEPVSATYETTACALNGLEAALYVDFPCSKRKRKWKTTVAAWKQRNREAPTWKRVRLLQMRVYSWKGKVKKMQVFIFSLLYASNCLSLVLD